MILLELSHTNPRNAKIRLDFIEEGMQTFEFYEFFVCRLLSSHEKITVMKVTVILFSIPPNIKNCRR